MADLTTRDAKLVQYLNEAYGKEKELETALEAHISMTTRAPYRKRLQQHLSETKRHAREVERRVRQLGGEAEVLPLPGPDALTKGASAAVELGSRAVAAAKGPLHAIRGTGEQEKMLKNAKTEYSEEHEEIATYRAIEELATSLGDAATAQLARAIRREEERMASFLARLIPTLTKAVVQEEVPASERPSSRRGGKKRSTAKRASSRSAAKRSPARAAAKRATGARRKATGAKAGTAKGSARAGGAASKRSSTKRSGAKRAAAKSPARTAKRTAAKASAGGRGAAKRAGGKTAARASSARARAKR
jgi:ferritin-like metal-binding protein YciE